MQLSSDLSAAIDALAYDIAPAELARASEQLTAGYRSAERTGAALITSPAQRAAYAVVRMPATFAAVAGALAQFADAAPGFAPRTLLDLGSGPGTVMWAAAEAFPSIEAVTNLERDAGLIGLGKELAAHALHPALPRAEWARASLLETQAGEVRDLVAMSYVLGEIPADQRAKVVEHAWKTTAGILLIVEPGTPAGYETILSARAQLIAQSAHIAAPCPHARECPLRGQSWCHFTQRLARSSRHRTAKGGVLGYEDEPYSYVAFSRYPVALPAARIISTPQVSKAEVRLKLCAMEGIEECSVLRRNKEDYKRARKRAWGSPWP